MKASGDVREEHSPVCWKQVGGWWVVGGGCGGWQWWFVDGWSRRQLSPKWQCGVAMRVFGDYVEGRLEVEVASCI